MCEGLYERICACIYGHIHMFLFVNLSKLQFKFYHLRLSTFLESEDILAGRQIFQGCLPNVMVWVSANVMLILVLLCRVNSNSTGDYPGQTENCLL